MTTPQTPQLPPLPEPYAEQVIEYSGVAVNRVDRFNVFTADQMQAYARAALEAQKAAAPELVGLTDEQIDALWQDDELSMPNKIRRRIVASEAISLFCRINNLPTGTASKECEGCNGRGEVGGLRADGYHNDTCPLCKGAGTASDGGEG
jgi:hypothetical protein